MSLENVVMFLNEHKEKPEAIQLLETFAKYAWQFAEYDDISKCFFKIKEYTQAIKYGELALSTAYTNERMWVARSNLINVYNHANYPEKAMTLIKANETVIPGDVDTLLEKSFSHFLLNEKDQAEQILRDALERTDLSEETYTKIRFNLGTYELYRDNFLKGLSLFLFEGKKLEYWKKPELPGKFWDGGVQPGKKIVLSAEAGIGDEIINVRFMQHFRNVGMEPIWFTDRQDMAKVFRANGYPVITSRKEIPPDALWTHSMNVPVYLGLTQKDLWTGPYLKSLPEYDEKMSLLFANAKKVRIGIRWQGNPEYDHDLHRSVKLSDIMDVLNDVLTDDVQLYSLQRDTGVEERYPYPEVIDLEMFMQTYGDTFSIINNLDYVITTCTSVAHAAASMGKRTFIFVPISAYYTWSHSTVQSPWYSDNVTLLRQVKPRCWKEPIQQLRQILQEELQ